MCSCVYSLRLKVSDSYCGISGVWKNLSLLERLKEERDGAGQQQWIIYDGREWPHAAIVLLLLFYPNSSYTKQHFCRFDCSQNRFQAAKQTSDEAVCICFTFCRCFVCSGPDMQCSRISYIRTRLHAAPVTSRKWRARFNGCANICYCCYLIVLMNKYTNKLAAIWFYKFLCDKENTINISEYTVNIAM